MESGARNEEIDSIEVVFYKGSCDNIYVKTREYYENYKKRQALRSVSYTHLDVYKRQVNRHKTREI